MATVVLDASVIVAAQLDEPLTPAAVAALAELDAAGVEAHAPDLLLLESASALSKASRRGELTPEQALEALERVLAVEIQIHSGRELSRSALALALVHGVTTYDACYLGLSISLGAVLITGDSALAGSANAGGFAVRLLEA